MSCSLTYRITHALCNANRAQNCTPHLTVKHSVCVLCTCGGGLPDLPGCAPGTPGRWSASYSPFSAPVTSSVMTLYVNLRAVKRTSWLLGQQTMPLQCLLLSPNACWYMDNASLLDVSFDVQACQMQSICFCSVDQ